MTPVWLTLLSLKNKMEFNDTFLPPPPPPPPGPTEDLADIISLAENLNLYYVPFILTTGLSLHIVCCFGFTKTKLNKRFFPQLFLAISVADIGFLLTLLLIWLNDLKLDIYAAPGMCPMVIFMSHFFPFLSFWHSIIAAGFLLLQPFNSKANKFARGHGRGKIVVICFSVFAFTVYLYKTWTNGVLKIGKMRFCTVLQETRDAMKVLNILDVLFLLLLPFIGFVVFDIIVCLRQFNIKFPCRQPDGHNLRISKDAIRVVAAHSVAFIVFVGPGCFSKLCLIFKGGPEQATNIKDLLLENLFQYLFYTYFALTPILHITMSSSFRSHVRLWILPTKRNVTLNRNIDRIYHEEPNSEQTLL